MLALHSISPNERGQRAKSVRLALRYSRRALAKKYHIKATTLQNWEDGRYGGLTEKGARLLAEIYQTEELDCRPEWLLYGIGPNPLRFKQPISPKTHAGNEQFSTAEQLLITEELKLFRLHHHDVIDAIVADDGMMPSLWVGDHVAGERYFHDDIAKIVDTFCIVQLTSGQTLTRFLHAGSKPGLYQLICTNFHTTADQQLNDVTLFSATPILWIRRMPLFYKK